MGKGSRRVKKCVQIHVNVKMIPIETIGKKLNIKKYPDNKQHAELLTLWMVYLV
jgi:hypothetical protein